MSTIEQPTESQLDNLVEPYLTRQQLGLGFAIGYASPDFTPPGNLYFRGNVQNQFGARLSLDGDTLFEIASISKTLPSRPGGFHPEPLTDPDVILSHHPARATERRPPPSVEK